MDQFYNWPLSKQYLAAHYYLSEEKPISISEAQRAQLGALHLFVSFGKYSPEHSIPDLNLCSQAERKKRIDEWKKLSILTKSTAMQKFLDLITSLFPNWIRSRKLLYEFQLEWNSLQGFEHILESDKEKVKPKDLNHTSQFSAFRRAIGKSMISSYDFSKLDSQQSFIKVKKDKVTKVKKNKFARTQSIDIQNSMYSFKEITFEQENNNNKIPIITDSIKQHKSNLHDKNSLKHFIEDLQSHKGGNIRQTSATKFPVLSKKSSVPPLSDLDPPINFDKELKQYRRSLLQKELSKYKNNDPPSLGSEFDKLHEKLSSLKLSLQQFTN